MSSEIQQWMKDTVSDIVADLLYYDRKSDEEVGSGVIEAAVSGGSLSEEQIVAWFATALHLGLTEGR